MGGRGDSQAGGPVQAYPLSLYNSQYLRNIFPKNPEGNLTPRCCPGRFGTKFRSQ